MHVNNLRNNNIKRYSKVNKNYRFAHIITGLSNRFGYIGNGLILIRKLIELYETGKLLLSEILSNIYYEQKSILLYNIMISIKYKGLSSEKEDGALTRILIPELCGFK